jgi:endonuclease G, mitochondrial
MIGRALLLLALCVAPLQAREALPPPTAEAACYRECPEPEGWFARRAVTVLDNPGFRIGWSSARRSALWVAYQLDPLADRGQVDARPDGYTIDTRTRPHVRSEEYRNTGFDRGHLAANGIMSRWFGPNAQRAAMRMSNIAPQTARLNRGAWQRLEMAETDIWLEGATRVWVVTGPIWGPRPPALSRRLPVPEAFYRIWVREMAGQPLTVTAFRLPQQVCGDETPRYFKVPLATIAEATGLDFGPLTELAEPDLSAKQRAAMDALPLRYASAFQRTPRPEGCGR